MLELRVQALAQEWEPERALERAQVLPLAQQVVVTEIGADFSGDAFAPELDNTWQPLHTSPQHTSSTGLPHRFVTYGRKPQSGDAT